MPYEEQQRDFNLKYESTYIAMKGGGINLPLWIDDIDEDEYIRGRIWNEGKGKFTSSDSEIEISDPDLITTFPRLGALNLTHSVVVIRRLAKRQWRKVLNAQVIQLHDPFEEERDLLGLPRIKGVENDTILLEIFNPVYPNREQAWERIAAGDTLAVAITPEWYLGVKAHAEGVKLFKDDLSVGTVTSSTTVELYPEAQLLKEQVIGLGYKVEAA